MMKAKSSNFYLSNVSLVGELDKARDFVKGSIKALNIGGSQQISPESEQPILSPDEESTKPSPKSSGWTPLLILTGVSTTLGSSIPVGYNIGVMNTPQNIIQEFCNLTIATNYGISMTQSNLTILWSSIVSIFLVGGICGSLTGAWMADKFGRKGTVYANHAICLLAAFLFVSSKPAMSVEMLILARLLVGLASGLTTSTLPMYLTELAPLHLRGAMGVLCPLGLTVGVVVAQVLGLRTVLGQESTWHYLLGLYAVLVLLSAVTLPILPESPKYLYIVCGEEEKGIQELARIRGLPREKVEQEFQALNSANKLEAQTKVWTVCNILQSKSLRLPLMLVCALQAGQQFSGINAVFYYSVPIFQSAGLSEENSQYASIGAGGINFIVAVLVIPLVNSYGRKKLAMLSCGMASVCLILLTVSITYINEFSWMPYFSIVCVLSYVFTYGLGLGPIPYFIGSELFELGPRPLAMSFGSMANWGGNFIIGMTFPTLQSAIGQYSFLIFAATTLMLCLFLYQYLPETRGRNPSDIAEMLRYGLNSKIRPFSFPKDGCSALPSTSDEEFSQSSPEDKMEGFVDGSFPVILEAQNFLSMSDGVAALSIIPEAQPLVDCNENAKQKQPSQGGGSFSEVFVPSVHRKSSVPRDITQPSHSTLFPVHSYHEMPNHTEYSSSFPSSKRSSMVDKRDSLKDSTKPCTIIVGSSGNLQTYSQDSITATTVPQEDAYILLDSEYHNAENV